jgi:hypothetical protein
LASERLLPVVLLPVATVVAGAAALVYPATVARARRI